MEAICTAQRLLACVMPVVYPTLLFLGVFCDYNCTNPALSWVNVVKYQNKYQKFGISFLH